VLDNVCPGSNGAYCHGGDCALFFGARVGQSGG
jgi:hypothetical protein